LRQTVPLDGARIIERSALIAPANAVIHQRALGERIN